MSTAEQIIAEHRWDERRGICECMFVPEFGPGTRYERMTVEQWAAHVVAALTNAGKQIVDLPAAGTDEYGNAEWETGPALVRTFPDGLAQIYFTDEVSDSTDWHPKGLRELAAALLAAARVAEGGERGE